MDPKALGPNVLQTHLVLLLDPRPQVLQRESLLGQLHLELAALILEGRHAGTAFLQLFLAAVDLALLELPVSEQLVDLIGQNGPFAREPLDLAAALADARLEVGPAILELPLLGLEPLDGRAEFADAGLERAALTLVGGQQLLLGGEGDLGVVEGLARGIAPIAQLFQATAQFGDLGPGIEFALLPLGHLGGKRFPLLDIARLLTGQGLEIPIDLSQANLKRPLGGLKCIELALTGGHGDLLLAQFHPHLFESQLQGRLLGLESPLLPTGLGDAVLQRGDLGLEFGDLILATQDARRRLARGALGSTGEYAEPVEDLARGRHEVPAGPSPAGQGQGGVQVGHDQGATQQSRHEGRHRGLDLHDRQRRHHALRQGGHGFGRDR